MGKRVNSKRSRYFQTIARHFFRHRGSPFFLSSKDLDLISRWESMRIPLRVVLDGMRETFEPDFPRKRKKDKVLSLSYCQPQVLKAFGQYKERAVGRKGMTTDREEKRKKAKSEVDDFLNAIPSPVDFLKEKFLRAQDLLTREDIEEEVLERIEEDIEEMLVANFKEEEAERIRQEVRREFRSLDDEQISFICKTRIVKRLREKHRIPFISLFYY